MSTCPYDLDITVRLSLTASTSACGSTWGRHERSCWYPSQDGNHTPYEGTTSLNLFYDEPVYKGEHAPPITMRFGELVRGGIVHTQILWKLIQGIPPGGRCSNSSLRATSTVYASNTMSLSKLASTATVSSWRH